MLVLLVPLAFPHSLEHSLGLVHLVLLLPNPLTHSGVGILRIGSIRLPAWPRSTSDDPYFGPYKILSVDDHRITVRCSARLGCTLVCAAQQLKRYYEPEDLCGEEWELNDEEIAALDL